MKAGKCDVHSWKNKKGRDEFICVSKMKSFPTLDANRSGASWAEESENATSWAEEGQVGTGQRIIEEEFTSAKLVIPENEQTYV